MAIEAIPTRTQVLVIGGGPGGSYAAAVLAREGLDVVVLEADRFPRYHIGESMVASIRHLLRFVDVEEKFNNHGFVRKVGAAFKIDGHKREGYTDFTALDPENYAWNVVRAESDEILFRHAGECGARIFDATKVTSLTFAGDPAKSRPVFATWGRKDDEAAGTIAFDYLIDASGRAGLMSTKYLKNRVFNRGLKNVANWGYWTGCGVYGEGTPRENSPYFEALTDESGWAWFIPLHNGTTSIGIVMNQEVANKKKANHPSGCAPSAMEFYLEQLQLAPALLAIIGMGQLKTDERPAVKSASDYSYSAPGYAGEGYRIVGDAGAFIDPFFSSGVHLALTGALSAATSISASIRGEVSESEAARWHSEKISIGYTRFLIVVLSAYKQMRAQEQPVLSDIDEDNFDRAFSLFRPVIQGTADINKSIARGELARTVEFCAKAFTPTQPVDRDAVLSKVTSTAQTPAVGTNGLPAFDANLSSEEQNVLDQINARKVTNHLQNDVLSTDVVLGLRPRLIRGSLGLDIVPPQLSG